MSGERYAAATPGLGATERVHRRLPGGSCSCGWEGDSFTTHLADVRAAREWARAVLTDNPNGLLGEVMAERCRQDEKWGEQNHPDVPVPASVTTDPVYFAHGRLGIPRASEAKAATDRLAALGKLTWGHIAVEELAEAVEAAAEGRTGDLRVELVQLAAVCLQWAQAIDRRQVPAVEVDVEDHAPAGLSVGFPPMDAATSRAILGLDGAR